MTVDPNQRPKASRVLRPLAPSTYLLRNASKTVPLIGVITLAVLLITSVIALINSITLSIKTTYSYNRAFLGVTPRGDPTETARIVKVIQKECPVPLGRIMIVRGAGAQVRSIVGDWPFFVVGMSQDDMRWYLHRQGGDTVTGRLPSAGAAEALVSRPVATNLRLKIGDTLLSPKSTDSFSPNNVRVVGIAETNTWLMMTSVEYLRAYHFPNTDSALVSALDPNLQPDLDKWATKRFEGSEAELWTYEQIEERTNKMFKTLYLILDVVIGILSLVITFMMGMLMNIYQSQRLVEFGLLQAIGYTKAQLLRRVATESVIVIVLGWICGLVGANLLLHVVKAVLMDPNAFALDPLDRIAYLYTVPVPAAIAIVAFATVTFRFRRFDPVGIVERRLV